MDTIKTQSCICGDEMASYVYGELSADRHASFEEHLVSCSDCVAEFAAISEARLGVYEWCRDDFKPLATPQFVIPTINTVEEPRISWVDALKGLLSPVRLAGAGGLAVVLLAVGSFLTRDGVVDRSSATNESTSAERVVAASSESDPAAAVSSNESDKKAQLPEQAVLKDAPSHESTASKPTRIVRTRRNDVARVETEVKGKEPRLANYDEVEDTSLRLSDMVAELDDIDSD